MNYMLHRFFDFSSYTLLTVSAATNWDNFKGDASFIIAFIVAGATLYCKYLEIRDRRRKAEKEEKGDKNNE